MTCQDLPELCPDYHAGALDQALAALYEAHLASCAACHQADQDYAQGLASLPDWPVQPSARSDEEFLAALFASPELQAASRGPVASPLKLVTHRPTPDARRSTRSWAPLALAASLLLLFGSLAVRERPAQLQAVDDPGLLASLGEQDDPLAWAELGALEQTLFESLGDPGEHLSPFEGVDIDPAQLEEGLWADLAQEADPEDPGLEPELSLEDAIEQLDPVDRQQLMQLFEQG